MTSNDTLLQKTDEWHERNRRNLTYGRVIFPSLTVASAIAVHEGVYWLAVGCGIWAIVGAISLQHGLTRSSMQVMLTTMFVALEEELRRGK